MAQKEKNDEEISAAKIYQFLKTKNVPNQMFQEMLSEMKDKKGFKQVKKMIEDLISKHESVLYNPATDKSQRAIIFNEVCSIAFTIDTIFPNVLRMKLQHEFPNLINEILEELKREKKIESFVPYSAPEINVSASEGVSKKSQIPLKSQSQKSVTEKKNVSSIKKVSPVNGTHIKTLSDRKCSPEQNNLIIQENLTDEIPVHEVQEPEIKKEIIYDDSDAESTISIGNSSLLSVSSVRTSDLSSFDDEISIYSGEENGMSKKKISLNDLRERLYQNDSVSSSSNEDLDDSKLRKLPYNIKKSSDTKNFKYSKKTDNTCVAYRCTNKVSHKIPDITFHCFPKDEKYRQLWIEAVGWKNWTPSPNSKLCSEHFSKEMMDFTSSFSKLKENAVPTIFKSHPSQLQQVPSLEDSSFSSNSSELISPHKVLPQRQRKPNSRYASDSIVCPIAQKQQKRTQCSSYLNDNYQASSQKRVKSEILNDIGKIEASKSKGQKCPIELKSVDLKNTKIPVSPSICKPYIAVHPLTSRGATPVKLFSTPKQNRKE